jgi:hypothetical protein
MNKDEWTRELKSILNGIDKVVSEPVATSCCHAYTRLKRARLDVKDALNSLK